MRVGVPKEIKDHEDRVGWCRRRPPNVHHGHEVLIERGAGQGAAGRRPIISRRRADPADAARSSRRAN